MYDFGSPQDPKLQEAEDLIQAGQKKPARKLLREILASDHNNLSAWELIWRTAHNLKEEIRILNRILALAPDHIPARKRLDEIEHKTDGTHRATSHTSKKRPSSRRRKQQSTYLFALLGGLFILLCISVVGYVAIRGGYIPFGAPVNLTATVIAQKEAGCQVLIQKAIQASGDYCDNTDTNNVCYGNTTIQAELVSNVSKRFSERGDKIKVNELKRLSAAPLDIGSEEWGIAVFKIIANLPRSLPGETVTMVVFGNSTLDNTSNNDSGALESFYFTSELGQIACEKVPFDGIMVSSPDGGGLKFNINGSELTLTGSAAIKAIRNGEMEISIYKGSGHIVSNGQEQYFGAGQQVTVQLGGENGNESVSGPSTPKPIGEEELDVACSLTNQYCTYDMITPVSEAQAVQEVQAQITPTPSLTPTQTLTLTPTQTLFPTYTLFVLPSSTFTPSKTPTKAPTNTPAPTRTPLPPTATSTRTKTAVPTSTPVPPSVPVCGTVLMSGISNPNPNELGMTITNNSGSPVTINRVFVYWEKTTTSQKLDRLLINGASIWNISDNDSPSDIPTEGNFQNGANLTIPNATPYNFVVHFQDDLIPTGYEVHVFFDSGCQVFSKK